MLHMVGRKLAGDAITFHGEVTEEATYCAVLASDLGKVCRALNSLGMEYGPELMKVWHGRGFQYDQVSFAEKLSGADAAEADSIVIGLPYQIGRQCVDRSGGVEILIVDPRGPRFVARRQRAAKVDWTAEFSDQTKFSGKEAVRARKPPARLHALEGEPVDAVYTWVDSHDAAWLADMREWAARQEMKLDSSRNYERYLDRGELRYSLRSLWLYAPYIRNIFIITAGQYPAWLDREHEKIHVIPHRAIFPDPADLPTFNSHAIEACLHRIPGLSEHFLYFNDDVFLGRETTVSTFFTKGGLIKSRLSTSAAIPVAPPGDAGTPTDWASYNAGAMIRRDFGMHFDRKLKHVPMAMKRSLLAEIESRYSDAVVNTRRSRFRSPSDLAIPTMLAHFYGISVGQAVEWEHVAGEYMYADTGRQDFEARLAAIAAGTATFFCLNATRHDDIPLDRQLTMLDRFLADIYPLPSPFELAAPSQ